MIDIDQGQSGASAADREGFQQLVAEVSLGRAGIVLGLECSRLARNSADWHQLLELCGMTGTLICDEDGLYDPRNFNDRLLLGLKGALSEAELHFIRARLRGGQLSKARRGELIMPLPIGLVYDAAGHVILDPDTAIAGALRHLFTTFEATGSATACVKAFRAAGLTFPWRHQKGPRKTPQGFDLSNRVHPGLFAMKSCQGTLTLPAGHVPDGPAVRGRGSLSSGHAALSASGVSARWDHAVASSYSRPVFRHPCRMPTRRLATRRIASSWPVSRARRSS